MTARAMGRIPTVEPLMHSMYLTLPAMPSDYTEDTFSESEPSEFIDNQPDVINFIPSTSSTKCNENTDLVESMLPLEFPQYNVAINSGINTEKQDNKFQFTEDNSETGIDANVISNPLAPRLYNLNAEERRGKRKGTQGFLRGILNNSNLSGNISSEVEITPNILPQVNYLRTASQSMKPSVEFDLTTSTNESELHQHFNHIDKPLHEPLTNIQNLPTQKALEIDKLDISKVQNLSNDDNRNQQTQIDRVNQKKIAQKTFTYDLKNQNLLPQVNRVETAKSVKPDIELNAVKLNLQNPLQQHRSIYPAEKTTTGEILKIQTEESKLVDLVSQFNNNSQSQTPISSQQQSIPSNLHLRSNLVNQEHHNTEFVEKSQTQNSISIVRPNSIKQKSVIPLGEDTGNLLRSPIVKTLSPIHSQTEFRRHQAESQPSPTIEVTIGRIEVRGIQPEPSPKSQGRKSTKKSPALSLSDYLKQRDGK
jgi:hypothetical protein